MKYLDALVLLTVLAGGCSEKKAESTATAEADRKKAEQAAIEAENKAPVPPKPPAKPSRFEAEVDLTFTGAIEKKLSGPIGVCGATFIDGRVQGGNYGIRTDDFEFQVIALSDKELTSPKSFLNTKGPDRKSFVTRDTSKISIDVAKGATIDVELKNITGPETVKVTGTVTCGPDYRK